VAFITSLCSGLQAINQWLQQSSAAANNVLNTTATCINNLACDFATLMHVMHAYALQVLEINQRHRFELTNKPMAERTAIWQLTGSL